MAIDQSPWNKKLDRFVNDSFAPMRKGNKVRIMIDGDMYFRNVAEEMEKAESEIFISDWWMCPKYYLVRPVSIINEEDNVKFRLDNLLLRAVRFLAYSYVRLKEALKFTLCIGENLSLQFLSTVY